LETGAGVGIEIGIGVIEAIVIVGSNYKVGFGIGTIFKKLSNIIGHIEDFFLKAGVGIRIVIGVFGAVEIIGAVETGAARGVGLEAFSYTRHGKIVL
jgi:hypothetical protein